MTAKENVLAIYPNAIAHRRNRIARDAKPNEFMIEIIIFPSEEKLATLSTTFCSPEMIEDVAWEQAWITIQKQMLEKLAEDPEDRRRYNEQEEEQRREREYYARLREEEIEWEQRLYDDLEKKAANRRRI
jgi:hypothetical protein